MGENKQEQNRETGLTIFGWIWTVIAPIILIIIGQRSDNESFNSILQSVILLVLFIGIQVMAGYRIYPQMTGQLALALDFFVLLAGGIMVTLMYTDKPPKTLAIIGMGCALFAAGFIHRFTFKKGESETGSKKG